MSATKMMHIRVDEELRDQAIATFAQMGIDASAAVRMFLKRVVVEQAIPFPVKVPNATTRAAMEEARGMKRGQFSDAETLFDTLDGDPTGTRKRKARRIPEGV